MHLNSELVFKKYAIPFFKPATRVLEIGPYGYPSAYQKIINDNSIEWQTLNLVNSTLDEMMNKDQLTVLANDPYHYPVPDDHYDIVVSGNVMEHVQDIIAWYKELKRIVKPGGHIITVMPLSWPYHEAPMDCWRIYPEGFNTIFETVGIEKVICVFETLEFEHCYPKRNKKNYPFIAGRSIYWGKSKTEVDSQLNWNEFIKKIPFLRRFAISIEVAFDTISIARKK
jgi:SAM-dependent methyltransferase